MKSDLRTVIDTGVVVSAALLPRSVPRQAFDLAAARGRLLVSDKTIAELDDVLRRPKFDKYVSETRRLEFLSALVQEAEVIDVVDVVTLSRPEGQQVPRIGFERQRHPYRHGRFGPACTSSVPGDYYCESTIVPRDPRRSRSQGRTKR